MSRFFTDHEYEYRFSYTTGGCPEGLGAFRFFFKHYRTRSRASPILSAAQRAGSPVTMEFPEELASPDVLEVLIQVYFLTQIF